MRRWFLSYNSQDLALVQGLEEALRREEPEAHVYFAPKSERAGGFWLPSLANEIGEATVFVLLIGEKGVGPWQVLEYNEALARRVLGMVARGDRDHDVAAWFGVNQGRVKDTKDGKFGNPAMASADALPPSGPPGVKGRRARDAIQRAIDALANNDPIGAKRILEEARAKYDANES
jgi:hypothetical protein